MMNEMKWYECENDEWNEMIWMLKWWMKWNDMNVKMMNEIEFHYIIKKIHIIYGRIIIIS
jgi:hypothetical protein